MDTTSQRLVAAALAVISAIPTLDFATSSPSSTSAAAGVVAEEDTPDHTPCQA
jgi:hypothetical protein